MYAETTLAASDVEHCEPVSLDTEALGDIISRLSIPPCPQVLQALLSEFHAESVDFQRVVRLISGDVSLAAAMIRAANSPVFALRHRVQGVQQAVTVLGLKHVTQMVAGLELERLLSAGVPMERFWERSNLHAVCCAALARHCRGVAPEDAYTYGLFHDCGIPILMQYFSDYKQTLNLANHASRPVPEVEHERHGTSHVAVGSLLAADWQLAEPVLSAIRGHHDPILLEDEEEAAPVKTLIALSILADHLVARFLQVEDESEWFAWGLQAMEYLGFDTPFVDQIYPDIALQFAETLAARGSA